MSSEASFVKEFEVPEGFQGVLRDFSREVLRAQPEDIPAFAYQYFKQQAETTAAATPENS